MQHRQALFAAAVIGCLAITGTNCIAQADSPRTVHTLSGAGYEDEDDNLNRVWEEPKYRNGLAWDMAAAGAMLGIEAILLIGRRVRRGERK